MVSRCSQPALSPSWGRQCPGSLVALQALDAHSHGAGRALTPCPVTVSSRFLLFFFPPSNTSPRSAQGGGSTISHCECLSLYCSARQNTVCLANKHPFICRPQLWEFRENDSSALGSSSLLGWESPPSAHSAGTVLSDPTDGRAMVNFIPLSLFLMKG